jgi:predicted dehydrogenase
VQVRQPAKQAALKIFNRRGGKPGALSSKRPQRRSLYIVGEAGTILADLLAPRLQVYRDGNVSWTQASRASREPICSFAEMQHFLRCVAGEDKPVVSLRGESQSLAMALAARESLERRQVVYLS